MRSHPEFEGLITTSRDLQITMTKMRQREYYYVLNTHPDKISRDKGAVQWANFKWTKAYEKALQGIDPEYAELMEAEAGLKVKNQGHPDWPAARAAFTEVMKTREYKEILKALMDKITGIDEGLRMTR
ncbi:MAG: hypothetical protein HUN04_22510 [Desulfobacter sp.]|nr:MAG: hypothetical protein HUN04_22510 [Desulfobacter sp.]